MIAPWWLCGLFVAVLYVWLPLDAWLVAWPTSVKHRNSRVRPVYRHEW